MKYEESLPHELEAEITKMPVAYLPWGAHEWHGVHNPVGVDGLKAQFLADELCKETGGVVFPTVYCGHSTIGFQYCLEFSAKTIESLARDYLSEISKFGFKLIVLVMGHWADAHIKLIRRIMDEFNDSQQNTRAWALQDNEMTDAFGYPEDHGGVGETSYIMACLPGKVDMSLLPTDRPLTPEKDGIIGVDPRPNASAQRGKDAAEIYVREAAKRVRELL